VIILDLYFLDLGLQIGFRGLNLQVIAGVALTICPAHCSLENRLSAAGLRRPHSSGTLRPQPRDGNGEFPVGDQPPIPVPARTHFPRPRTRQHLRGEIFYCPRPPWGIHPRRGPRPREMAQRTDVQTSAAGVAHGGEGLVRPSCGWR
jgi:hypothetical protein